MNKAYKFRLYPNRAQTAKLNHTLNICRTLYNAALEQRRTAWKSCRQSVSVSKQMAELPDLKRELPEVNEVYSQVLQDVLWRADRSFQNFFRRVKKGAQPGYPRFQGWRRYGSFCYPQLGFSLNQGHVCLSKIGNLRIRLHRPIEGRIKTCTLKREVDEWYAVFTCELPDTESNTPQNAVGIDVGIESFAVTSDGEFVDNPRYLVQSQAKLRRLQRSLSRKHKGAKHHEKARILVAKQHRKVRRQRLDFQHKVTHHLISRYDTIVIEDLNVSGMVQNHNLAKHISDVAWSQFANILSCKAVEAGKQVIRVVPQYTSQVCSGCGCVVSKELSERWHQCPDCGLCIHRDINAARNILFRAGALPLGVNVAERVASVAQEAHVF